MLYGAPSSPRQSTLCAASEVLLTQVLREKGLPKELARGTSGEKSPTTLRFAFREINNGGRTAAINLYFFRCLSFSFGLQESVPFPTRTNSVRSPFFSSPTTCVEPGAQAQSFCLQP